MMKWFAFVGAAFVANSAAISIGSTDAESMTEAYPEFHFAQLDLDTGLEAGQAKKTSIPKAAKKAPAKKTPAAVVGGTGKGGDPGKGVPVATKTAYKARAKKATAESKKIAADAAALNKATEAKLAAALKEIDALKNEKEYAAFAAKQKKENDKIKADAEKLAAAAKKQQDDAEEAVKAIQGAVTKKQALIKKVATTWQKKVQKGKQNAFAKGSHQQKLDAAKKKATDALAELDEKEKQVADLQKKIDSTPTNWVAQIKAEYNKLSGKDKKKLEKIAKKELKKLAKEAKDELKEYVQGIEDQANESADVSGDASGEGQDMDSDGLFDVDNLFFSPDDVDLGGGWADTAVDFISALF